MRSPRPSLLFLLCWFAASCGGDEFSAAPAGTVDSSVGGSDAGADASGGKGGAGDASLGGAGGTAAGGQGGTAGKGGTAGVGGGQGGTSGTGGTAGAGGTAGVGGTAGSGASGGTGGSSGAAGGVAGAGDSGGTAGAGGSGGSASCGSKQVCLDNFPAGWTPVVFAPIPPVECPPSTPLYSDDDFNKALQDSCDCSCNPSPSDTCSAKLDFFSNGCVSPPIATTSFTVAKCYTFSTSGFGHVLYTASPPSCTPPTVTITPPVINSAVHCSALPGGTFTPCGANNGVCVTDFPANKVCLYQNGSQGCPGAGYAKFTRFENYNDGRTCDGTCECTGKCKCQGSNCSVTLYGSTGCSGTSFTASAGDCIPKSGSVGAQGSIHFTQVPDSLCEESGGWKLEGGITGTSEVTICCPL